MYIFLKSAISNNNLYLLFINTQWLEITTAENCTLYMKFCRFSLTSLYTFRQSLHVHKIEV